MSTTVTSTGGLDFAPVQRFAKWVGMLPYKVSRIAQKAIQLGFYWPRRDGFYVPKIGRPPVLEGLNRLLPTNHHQQADGSDAEKCVGGGFGAESS